MIVILAILIIAVAIILFPVSYILTSHTRSSSFSFSTVTLTTSPANQDCSSSSQFGNNLDWTELGPNGTMHFLVISVNSNSTATLCFLYTKNPSESSNITEEDIGAWALSRTEGTSAPGVSVAIQPNQLNFGNATSSNPQFFVKVTITVSKSSSGYYILGATDVCQMAGLVVNQNPSKITGSAYSSLYEPSCGIYGAPVGRLVGLSGLSYGYADVPM